MEGGGERREGGELRMVEGEREGKVEGLQRLGEKGQGSEDGDE